jgi:prepilin-type N-terminal cleavage/methylation domain-containing protein
MTRKGFTLVEIMTVVAMMAALAVMVVPVLSDSLARGDARSFAMQAVDSLREAQSSTMSGRLNARYGVHFQADRFVLFQGATYSAGDADNLVHALSGNATITAVTLSPGGACTVATGTGNCDIHFARVKGQPTESGTVTFTDLTGATRTVSINEVGLIEWN